MSIRPENIIFTPSVQLMSRAISKDLYPSFVAALVELIFNGLDAANIRGVIPDIIVRVWKPGEHPLCPDSMGLSVLDNGTGMVSKAIKAFGMVGESVHTLLTYIHGKKGLGKAAAFALGTKDRFFITTNIGDDNGTWRYDIKDKFFDPKGFTPVEVVKKMPQLPTAGPFTEIFIPDLTVDFNIDKARDELTNLLPINRDWKVTVQGKPVKQRVFKGERFETEVIPALKGKVTFEFGVAEITAAEDTVFLIDSGSGRTVTDLHSLPATVKRELHLLLFHPRLIGQVQVVDLEKHCTSDRTKLKASFWSSAAGKALIGALNTFGVDLAKKVTGEDEEKPKGISKLLTDVKDVFDSCFGKADPMGGWNDGENSGPGGKKRESGEKDKSKKLGDGRNSGSGGNKPTARDGLWLKIEDKTYRILSFYTSSALPAEVRRGTIIVNTGHPKSIRLDKIKGNAQLKLEHLVHFLVEAHITETREASLAAFVAIHELEVKLLAGKQ